MHVIRHEQPGDEPAIRDILKQAFPGELESRLVDALRDSSQLKISLVALSQGQIVGHVAFSPVTTGTHSGLGLAPLAVSPQHQRKGHGAALVEAGLHVCRKQGVPFVVVLGDPAYYQRFDFAKASTWGLVDEYGGGDYFQAIELNQGTMPTDGLVKYGPAFSMFGGDESTASV